MRWETYTEKVKLIASLLSWTTTEKNIKQFFIGRKKIWTLFAVVYANQFSLHVWKQIIKRR